MNENPIEQRERTARRFWEPTPAEIAEACARIQQTWSARERRQRAGWEPRWTVPLVSARVEVS